MVNLDSKLILDVYGDGIVSMGDMPTWDMESLPEEEPKVDMDAAMVLNVAKAKARLYDIKGEHKDVESSILIATNASNASMHVTQGLRETAVLHNEMPRNLSVWAPMDGSKVMDAIMHDEHIQVPCLLYIGVDLYADHAAHGAKFHIESSKSLCAIEEANIGVVDMDRHSKEVGSREYWGDTSISRKAGSIF